MEEFAKLRKKLLVLLGNDPVSEKKRTRIDDGFSLIKEMAQVHDVTFPTT